MLFLKLLFGLVLQYATSTVLLFGLGGFGGMVIGGAGGSYLYRIDKRYPSLLSGFAAIFGCLPFWVLLNFIHAGTPFLIIAVVSIIAGISASITGPIVKASLQNVTFPEMRGQAFALYNLFDDFGRGIGPVFLAFMITRQGSRTPAFNLGVLGWVVCGILNASTYFTVLRDEDYVQGTIAARLSKPNPGILIEDGDGVLGIIRSTQ